MKRAFAIIFMMTLLLSLAACGSPRESFSQAASAASDESFVQGFLLRQFQVSERRRRYELL